jgi:hypothetical protein
LSLEGEASSPCDNLGAGICRQILAERMDIFNDNPLRKGNISETISQTPSKKHTTSQARPNISAELRILEQDCSMVGFF